MAKANFEKCQTRVVGVAAGKVCVELEGKPLQLGVAPVGIPGRTIVVGILCKGLGIVLPLFNVGRHSRRSTLPVNIPV